MTPKLPIYEIVRGPTATPVLIDDLKTWYYMSKNITEWDERCTFAIASAVENFEHSTNRKIVNQRVIWKPWRFGIQDSDYNPGRVMKLPFGQNSNVEIKYHDHDGAEQTFSDLLYSVEKNHGSNTLITLNAEEEWPVVSTEIEYPINVYTDCGWPVGAAWEASTSYALGKIIIPTFGNRVSKNMAYECVTAGTSGTTEPDFTTEIGGTTIDGTAEWECIGETVPYDVFVALLCMGAQRMRQIGITIERDPNYNILAMNWDHVVMQRTLHW